MIVSLLCRLGLWCHGLYPPCPVWPGLVWSDPVWLTGDLTECRIILDRRVLDWTVGLDSEINELVEGSDLYEPKVCAAMNGLGWLG